MALSEFVAMETAYRALEQLDVAGRRRALRWLNDALDVIDRLPEAAPDNESGDSAQTAQAEKPARRSPSRRSVAKSTAAGQGTSARARKRAAATASTAPSRQRRPRREGSGEEPQRAYRRMPAPEEVLDAYRQTGTITGVAEHFGVPRHTVQGWARRLRTQGHSIGRRG